MTGLNLELFLRLVRADVGPWVSFGVIVLLLMLMAWTSWGRRGALRKCLVLSIVVHCALLVYGGPQAARLLVPEKSLRNEKPVERIQRIAIVSQDALEAGSAGSAGRRGRLADWNRPGPSLALNDPIAPLERDSQPDAQALERAGSATLPDPVADASAPDAELPLPDVLVERAPENAPQPPQEAPAQLAEAAPGEEVAPIVEPVKPAQVPRLAMPDLVAARPRPLSPNPAPERERSENRVEPAPTDAQAPPPAPALAGIAASPPVERPASSSAPSPEVAPSPSAMALSDIPDVTPIGNPSKPARRLAMPDPPAPDRATRPSRPLAMPDLPRPSRTVVPEPPPLVHASAGGAPRLPAMTSVRGGRPLPKIPEVYRSRLAPNRSEIARRAGASEASEAAVERALQWLARHQDADGRWNGGTQKLAGGDGRTPVSGETNFTSHCPPNDPCSGDCFYWEADTAMTGLALLSFLGAGHTHREGKYARSITLGLNFLIRSQKTNGDLRGASTNVGMYCHAIASLALCEAYALTGEEKLRPVVQKAIDFLVQSRTENGLGWRYMPKDRDYPDTSILGWAIMVLKSAKETGIEIPPDVREGANKWLEMVAEGDHGGLAVYQPDPYHYPITETMTAEAWVCRQFLGIGGPGPASDEAATYLILHGPDRAPFNLYYWYYGTLSMYQHGGPSWTRWNDRVRDQLVRRQVRGGHADGSWDPAECKDRYDKLGGRIYCTALAALTLEVYYRYLRLYDTPGETVSNRSNKAIKDDQLRRTSADPLDILPRPDLKEPR